MSADAAQSLVALPPNQSLLILDSKYRKVSDTPFDFTTDLTSALVAREFYYQTLAWTSPIFTHNLTSVEIRIQFELEDTVDELPINTYAAYMVPWSMIKSFDGNENTTFNAAPVEGSYAFALESCLNDLRMLNNNLITNMPTVNGGNNIEAYVRYNASNGFNIFFIDTTTGLPTPFKILDCDWIQNAHYVHGYGVYDKQLEIFRPIFANEPSVFYTGYTSDAPPSLVYTRYVTIYSKELTRERRLISFSSANSDTFVNEIGVFSTNYKNVGVYHQNTVIADATVVSIREGSQPQYMRITISDEYGKTFKPGNPIGRFLTSDNVPPYISYSYFSYQYDHDVINLLCFGKTRTNTLYPGNDYRGKFWSTRTFLPNTGLRATGVSTGPADNNPYVITFYQSTNVNLDACIQPQFLINSNVNTFIAKSSAASNCVLTMQMRCSRSGSSDVGTFYYIIKLVSQTKTYGDYTSPSYNLVNGANYVANIDFGILNPVEGDLLRFYIDVFVSGANPSGFWQFFLTPSSGVGVTSVNFTNTYPVSYDYNPPTNNSFGDPDITCLEDDVVHQIEIVSRF